MRVDNLVFALRWLDEHIVFSATNRDYFLMYFNDLKGRMLIPLRFCRVARFVLVRFIVLFRLVEILMNILLSRTNYVTQFFLRKE